MTDLKPLLAKAASREPLTREEAREAFDILMSGQATPSQIGGFLMALRVRGETVDEIYGAVGSMRARMLPVSVPADAMDIVGTGGDGAGTYNISTLAAIQAPVHRSRGLSRPMARPSDGRNGCAGGRWVFIPGRPRASGRPYRCGSRDGRMRTNCGSC